jgi:hypothetical protein
MPAASALSKSKGAPGTLRQAQRACMPVSTKVERALGQPSPDQIFIPLHRPGQWLLQTPAQPGQQPTDRVHVIPDAKLAFYDLVHSPLGPTLSRKTSGDGPTAEQPAQNPLIGAGQLGWPPRRLAAPQRPQATARLHLLGSVTDGGTANA